MAASNELLEPETNLFIRHSLFKHDWIRRGTFDAHVWVGDQSADLLTSNGFFCYSSGVTECFSCGLVVRNWRKEDNPLTVHIERSPDCRFITGQDPSIKINLAAIGQSATYIKPPSDLRVVESASLDPLDQLRAQVSPARPAVSGVTSRDELYSYVRTRMVIPKRIVPVDGAPLAFNEPQWLKTMRSEKERLKTFSLFGKWPFLGDLSAETMAKNGFYYLQFADTVQCFACQAIIANWRVGHIIMDVHANAVPFCPMVLQRCPINVPLNEEPSADDLELQEAKDKLRCTLCLGRERNVVCLPCRHFGMCVQCSRRLGSRAPCPFCRQETSSKIQIYPQ